MTGNRTSAGHASQPARTGIRAEDCVAARTVHGPAGRPQSGRPQAGHTVLGLLLAASLIFLGCMKAEAATYPDSLWSWPTGHPVPVIRLFDPPSEPWLAGHRGVDLDGGVGTPILAPASGRVVYAGKLVDRPVISILHEGGLRSTYEPVEPTVSVGDQVVQGQTVGVLAAGHDGNTLHWGARFDKNEYIDPLRMLTGPAVLKPWGNY